MTRILLSSLKSPITLLLSTRKEFSMKSTSMPCWTQSTPSILTCNSRNSIVRWRETINYRNTLNSWEHKKSIASLILFSMKIINHRRRSMSNCQDSTDTHIKDALWALIPMNTQRQESNGSASEQTMTATTANALKANGRCLLSQRQTNPSTANAWHNLLSLVSH